MCLSWHPLQTLRAAKHGHLLHEAHRAFCMLCIADQLQLALADYNAALKLNPQHVDAYHGRGAVYEKKGQLDLAIQDFTTCLALDPNCFRASYSRAACRNRKGDLDLAIGKCTLKLASHGVSFCINNLLTAVPGSDALLFSILPPHKIHQLCIPFQLCLLSSMQQAAALPLPARLHHSFTTHNTPHPRNTPQRTTTMHLSVTSAIAPPPPPASHPRTSAEGGWPMSRPHAWTSQAHPTHMRQIQHWAPPAPSPPTPTPACSLCAQNQRPPPLMSPSPPPHCCPSLQSL